MNDPQSMGILSTIMPFIVMFAALYFFIIRPQQQQQKKRNAMLDALKKGDKVITIGGIYGEIVELHDESIILKVSDKVNLKMTRSSVSQVLD